MHNQKDINNDSFSDENSQSGQFQLKNTLNQLLNIYNIDKNKFINSTLINYYDPDNVIDNKNNLFDLICPICLNILNIPKSCSLNKQSHSFCKKCIDEHLKQYNNCPICKNFFEYRDNKMIQLLLLNLKFKCHYSKEGCNAIICLL